MVISHKAAHRELVYTVPDASTSAQPTLELRKRGELLPEDIAYLTHIVAAANDLKPPLSPIETLERAVAGSPLAGA